MRWLLLVLAWASTQLFASTCNKLVYSAHPNYPPFHWEESGRIVGASVDLTNLILNELNVAHESRHVGPWKRVLHSAEEGKIDLVLGLKDVPERRSYLAFTHTPLFENPVSAFIPEQRPFPYQGWDDLIGKHGTLNLGDRHGEAFDAFVREKLSTRRVAGLETNFNLLANGRTDFFITGLYPGLAFLEKYPDKRKVTYLTPPVLTGPIHQGFSLRSPCQALIPAFDQKLKTLAEQGVPAKVLSRNLKRWKQRIPEVISDTSISVGVLLANQHQGETFRSLIADFEQKHPKIHVKIDAYDDNQYKRAISHWANTGSGPDVFIWQAGERLFEYAEKGLIRNLRPLWEAQEWDQKFTAHQKSLVTYKQGLYGLPFAYYHWGFYFKKSLFSRLGLSPPANWEELKLVADTLSAHGVSAIATGTRDNWPAAAWFDYLNLRLNGIQFYQGLLRGQVAYTHPKVRQVFEHWKQLIDAGYFYNQHHELDWQEAMPLLYRENAGMMLIGNFAEQSIPSQIKSDIGFFPFPVMDNNVPKYELLPTEVFVLSSKTTQETAAQAILAYLSLPDVQKKVTAHLGYLPATGGTTSVDTPLAREGITLLNEAQGVMQFFDRDTQQAFSGDAVKTLSAFMRQPDIDRTIHALESLRLAHQ